MPILMTAFEPNDTDPIWLLCLAGEWKGPWNTQTLCITLHHRRGPLIDLKTPFGLLSVAQSAEPAIRMRGAQIVQAGQPLLLGPILTLEG